MNNYAKREQKIIGEAKANHKIYKVYPDIVETPWSLIF